MGQISPVLQPQFNQLFEGVLFKNWMPSNTDLDFGYYYGKKNQLFS